MKWLNMRGNFAIHRKLLTDSLWLSESFTRGQAWVDLIGLANWEAGYIRKRGIRVEIKRGQVGWSKKRLAKRWQWSRGKVTRFLNELKEDGRIYIKTNIKSNIKICTIITIRNYNFYQPKNIKSNKKRTSNGHQTDTKNINNKNNKNKKDITMNSNTQNADTASKDEKKKEYGNKQVNHVISSFKQYFHKDPVGTRKEIRFAARNMCQTINAKYREIKDTDGVAPMKNFKKAVDSCFREVAMDDFLADNIKTIRSAYNHSKEIIKNFTKKED